MDDPNPAKGYSARPVIRNPGYGQMGERQLTDLKPGTLIQSFDVFLDGQQIIFDRQKENADVVLIDLPR